MNGDFAIRSLVAGRRLIGVALRRAPWIIALATAHGVFCSSAIAVVPSGNTVPAIGNAGDFTSAVRISNVQGGRGTATLYMAKPDPDNAKNGVNYLDLCFVTADHVMRVVGGAGPSDASDTLPYDSNDGYGGAAPIGMQPGPANLFGSIGIGSVGDASAFSLTLGGGVVASKVILGDGLAKLNNLPTDMAFVGVTVDLNALTVAQRNILTAIPSVPLGTPPPIDPAAVGGAPFDFDVKGGYGVTGIVAAPPNNQYLYSPFAPAQVYGTERYFENTVQSYKEVANGIYDYNAMKWINGMEGPNVASPGMGMPGDSGSAIIENGAIIGVLTAGRMDSVPLQGGGNGLLLKNGYYEYAAQMVPAAFTNLTTLCATYTYATAPEPASWLTAAMGGAMLACCAWRRNKKMK